MKQVLNSLSPVKQELLTNDSDIEDIVRRGETIREKRTARGKRGRNIEVCASGINLPSSSVFDFGRVLLPRRPLVPESVQNDRCQWLDQALQDIPLDLRPESVAEGLDAGDEGAPGGKGEEDGPAEKGGVRQIA